MARSFLTVWCELRKTSSGGAQHVIVDAACAAACEAAMEAGSGTLQVGNVAYDVAEMVAVPGAAPSARQSPCGRLLRYECAWYFRTDGGVWAHCGPATCHALDATLEAGSSRAEDAERTYDLRKLTQRNRESGVLRPLLHVTSRGAAEMGPAARTWVADRPGNGTALPSVALYPQLSEVLEAQLRSYSAGCEIEAPFPSTNDESTDLVVSFSDGNGSMSIAPGGSSPWRLRRVAVSWLVRAAGVWEPLDVEVGRHLSMAVAACHAGYKHGDTTYDLLQFTESCAASQGDAPRSLLYVRGRSDAGPLPCPVADLRGPHPEVCERLMTMLDAGKSARFLRELAKESRLGFGMAVCNIVLRHGVIVKGGPVRDMAVLADGDFKDVDAECPAHVTRETFAAWVDPMIHELCDTLGVTVPAVGNGARYKSRTTFGALTQQPVVFGAATIIVVHPKVGEVEIELITPWNTDYSPPRNVDFTMNNLRLTAESPNEVGLIVPLGPTLTARRVIDETIRRVTRAVYDVAFDGGDGQAAGDGVDSRWRCVAKAPTEERRRRMQGRIDKFRGRGFRFLPLDTV